MIFSPVPPHRERYDAVGVRGDRGVDVAGVVLMPRIGRGWQFNKSECERGEDLTSY